MVSANDDLKVDTQLHTAFKITCSWLVIVVGQFKQFCQLSQLLLTTLHSCTAYQT